MTKPLVAYYLFWAFASVAYGSTTIMTEPSNGEQELKLPSNSNYPYNGYNSNQNFQSSSYYPAASSAPTPCASTPASIPAVLPSFKDRNEACQFRSPKVLPYQQYQPCQQSLPYGQSSVPFDNGYGNGRNLYPIPWAPPPTYVPYQFFDNEGYLTSDEEADNYAIPSPKKFKPFHKKTQRSKKVDLQSILSSVQKLIEDRIVTNDRIKITKAMSQTATRILKRSKKKKSTRNKGAAEKSKKLKKLNTKLAEMDVVLASIRSLVNQPALFK